MRAIAYESYGPPDVLTIVDVSDPEPALGQVVIDVRAVGLNAYDWRMLYGSPFLVRLQQGLTKPKNRILGSDVAGIVVAAGSQVNGFNVGDAVFGCLEGCGLAGLAAGGLAERVTAKACGLALVPDGLSFAQAAALPMAGMTALQALRDVAHVQPGQRVLVNGAAGGVGHFAVQIAKTMGAQVTGVCRTSHLELVASLGSDQVIDYQRENFTTLGPVFDTVIDVAANRPGKDLRRVLKPGGVCAVVGFSTMTHLVGVGLAGLTARLHQGKRFTLVTADNTTSADLEHLAKLVTAGQVTPVIDHTYPATQTREAFNHLHSGHPSGKITIDMANLSSSEVIRPKGDETRR